MVPSKDQRDTRTSALASLILAQSMAVALVEAGIITPDGLIRADSIAEGALAAIGESGDQAAIGDAERIARGFSEQLVSLRPARPVDGSESVHEGPSLLGLHSLC